MPLLTSCGELFDVDEAGETTSATMKMDRDTVFIMPGDSLRLTVTFSPPEVKDKGVMLSLIHISEPTRRPILSRMPSSA